MFWDPYFGWDTYMIRSCLFWAATICALASFICSTEGLGWDYPYVSLYSWASAHTDAVLITTILTLIAGFYYWKVQVGDM